MLRAVNVRLGLAALLAGLIVAALPATAPRADAYQPWGSTYSTDKILRSGCRYYTFNYRVHPPRGPWAAEIFLTNPRGRGIASKAIASNSDPRTGRLAWRLCRASLIYGRYRIGMKITYQESIYENREGWVRPSFFRMKRR
jgi:hypothetical protein